MSIHLLYSVREGLLAMRRSRLSALWTTSTIAVALTLFGIFLVLTYNVQSMVKKAQQQIILEAFIDGSLEDSLLNELNEQIQNLSGVKKTVYISKEDALERFKKGWGDDPLTILDENPLPRSFEIYIDKEIQSSNQVQTLKDLVVSLAGIDEVRYNNSVIEIINKWSRYVYIVDAVLFFLVLAAALFLVSNTLRLTILAQKNTIQIMQLVGATRGFIRRPYLVQGILQGAIGGGTASLVVWIIFKLVSLRINNLFELPAGLILTPMLLGIVLSFWGSEISVKRFLSDI